MLILDSGRFSLLHSSLLPSFTQTSEGGQTRGGTLCVTVQLFLPREISQRNLVHHTFLCGGHDSALVLRESMETLVQG